MPLSKLLLGRGKNHVKKLLNKIRPKKKSEAAAPASKITNETIAEHREKILAEGRRYKYPFQYAKHRLVINASLIAVGTLILLAVITWQQLYIAQTTNIVFYRVTKLLPLPIAQVGDVNALYSDYLLNYRSPEHFLKNYWDTTQDSEQGRAQLEYAKRQALDTAIADAYARKLAKERSISVSADEVDAEVTHIRSAGNGQLTVEAYDASAQKFLGMSPSDTRDILKAGLLRSKVAFAIDDKATTLKNRITQLLSEQKNDFTKVADIVNKDVAGSVTAGTSGLLNKSDRFDGISASDVYERKEGEVGPILQSVTAEGYFFVKVLEKTDTQVNFSYLRVPLTVFQQQLDQLRSEHKIKEYITIDADNTKQAPKE